MKDPVPSMVKVCFQVEMLQTTVATNTGFSTSNKLFLAVFTSNSVQRQSVSSENPAEVYETVFTTINAVLLCSQQVFSGQIRAISNVAKDRQVDTCFFMF